MSKYLTLFWLTLVLVSCGTGSDQFKIEGRLRHLNQGEFYIYSLAEGIDGCDTIKVENGRFSYELPCEKPMTLVIVFPNFSEQPVFAEPGESVSISGDASLLKEMTVKGTEDNELMNDFRQQIASASPPEMASLAARFIEDHPESPVSEYLLRKYFIVSTNPNYQKARQLAGLIAKAQPKNGTIVRLTRQLDALSKSSVGHPIPAFKAYGINGETITKSTFDKASYGLITVWASWSYESMDIQRELQSVSKRSHGQLKIVSICVDASKKDCRETLRRDSVSWPTVCDEQLMESPTLLALGLGYVPDNILLRNGKIIARNLPKEDLQKKLDELFP